MHLRMWQLASASRARHVEFGLARREQPGNEPSCGPEFAGNDINAAAFTGGLLRAKFAGGIAVDSTYDRPDRNSIAGAMATGRNGLVLAHNPHLADLRHRDAVADLAAGRPLPHRQLAGDPAAHQWRHGLLDAARVVR
jgi:hypothetical protein